MLLGALLARAPLAAAAGVSDPEAILTPVATAPAPVWTPFVDPSFSTTLRRVSDTSDRGGFETQIYSQLQAFSTDGRYLLLGGSAGYLVRRMGDGSLVSGLDTSTWNAPRWHPAQAHAIVHFDSNEDATLRVQRTDVETLATATVFTFPVPFERIRGNQSFDEISEDGRWLAGLASRADGADVLFAFNLAERRLGALLPLPAFYAGPCSPDPTWGELEPDWVGVSPLGRTLVVQWQRDGAERCSGLETFDLESGAFVGRVYDGHQHGDLGVDADGTRELFMTFELYHPSGRLSIGVRDLPGNATASPPAYVRSLDWGNGAHISCRGPRGACLVTAGHSNADGWTAFEGELFLQYIDGRVLRLAHHRSTECGYWVQPRATLSRDGRYAVFASDWGRGRDCAGEGLGRGDPYLLELGDGAANCGDGVAGFGEECDDGNPTDGDGCSTACRSELVAGGGAAGNDCLHEWLTSPPAEPNPAGLPRRRLECTDDDPTCDSGDATSDRACTFRAGMCFDVPERRFACAPAAVWRVKLGTPRASGDAADLANRRALEGALEALGGVDDGRAFVFRPPLAGAPRCSGFSAIRVPLVETPQGRARGQRVLRLGARTPAAGTGGGSRLDEDLLKLVCQPAP